MNEEKVYKGKGLIGAAKKMMNIGYMNTENKEKQNKIEYNTTVRENPFHR